MPWKLGVSFFKPEVQCHKRWWDGNSIGCHLWIFIMIISGYRLWKVHCCSSTVSSLKFILWALLNIFDTFCNYFPNQHKFIQVYNVINVLCSPWLFCMLSMKWGNINQQDWISKVWESRLKKLTNYEFCICEWIYCL